MLDSKFLAGKELIQFVLQERSTFLDVFVTTLKLHF